MQLTMLGTGHAMVTECYNTCFVLSDGNQRLLVDGGGGSGLLRQVKRAGVSIYDLRDVFVTHRHLDHLMGVVWLLRVWSQAMLHGRMEGGARIYAHDEVCQILANMASILLNKNEAALVGSRILLVELHDREARQVAGHTLVPFDIHSTKAKQFGFRLDLGEGRWLTCCGDEPLPRNLFPLAQDSDWLLHEAFCLKSEIEPALLKRMHHSSVADACATAQELGARNLVLYHSSDANLAMRQERYLTEGKALFRGNLYAPYDLDIIDLA